MPTHNPDRAIELEAVGKRYSQMSDRAMLLRSIIPIFRPIRKELWAVRGLDLTVERGETVGILGRNGAGKTTLLRMLAGVTQPTEGTIRIAGRVAPLLSVGVGFHQEMSGRENVYVNAMLLGMTQDEVSERFEEIVAFAELEEFIDTPVKFYSSGMYVRLGFSVAIHVEPQILLVDEVLAVGDIAFQLKCFDRMRELQNRGTTIVMVSHSMHAIRLMCPRALLFRKGHLEFDGVTEAAIGRHHQFLAIDSAEDELGQGEMPVTILHSSLRRNGVETAAGSQDDEFEAHWRIRFERPADSPHATFRILSEDGTLAYSMHTAIGTNWRRFAAGDETDVRVRFQPHFGGGGTFRIMLDITDTKGLQVLGADLNGLRLYLAPRLGVIGLGDALATIEVGGERLNDHGNMSLGANSGPSERIADRA